ncbi:uncharacterized protein MYCGRDRAFT_90346 [Zymoseptoria tritici IPO323]|uniref:Uncharacterized protein n=1 Tax=Zymoseptoria tritici (strain CBS 115943 / IPO323) TaxID=336722 RepID=F9X1Z6_ZYMTI|nr:uncharacterized protein MYCGRDRAFT_90346 [Zymoseptoria tritici IPO323]EGP89683.1 hypothetical protein MYCGRDRAFT_90346 [Zymoseptoria tritici IPO323]
MHFSHAILLMASALPAVVLADTIQGGLSLGVENDKRSVSPLLRRDDTPPVACTPPDDTTCIPKGVVPYTPYTCNIPLTNDPANIALDAVRRNGYPHCNADKAVCTCSVHGSSHDILVEVWREIISRQDPSLHIVDVCEHGTMSYDGAPYLQIDYNVDFSISAILVFSSIGFR